MNKVTTSVQIVLAQHCNGYKNPRLFGGQLMSWIDVIGAVAAQRFTGMQVTTVAIDHLNFMKPAFLGDTVVQKAMVTWSGKTSLEVRVDRAERFAPVNHVALGDDGKPAPVPKYIPETEEEKREYEAAADRRRIRLAEAWKQERLRGKE